MKSSHTSDTQNKLETSSKIFAVGFLLVLGHQVKILSKAGGLRAEVSAAEDSQHPHLAMRINIML